MIHEASMPLVLQHLYVHLLPMTALFVEQVQALPKATMLPATAKAPSCQDLLRYLAICCATVAL
jgi:hypothetical protein